MTAWLKELPEVFPTHVIIGAIHPRTGPPRDIRAPLILGDGPAPFAVSGCGVASWVGFRPCAVGTRTWLFLRSFFFFFIEVAGAGSRGHLYICFFYLFAVLYVWGSCKLRDSRDSSSPHERGSGIAPRPAHRVSLGDADGSVARCTLLLAIVAVLRYLPRGDAVASGDAAWKGMEGEGGGVMSHGRVTTSWLAGSVR